MVMMSLSLEILISIRNFYDNCKEHRLTIPDIRMLRMNRFEFAITVKK